MKITVDIDCTPAEMRAFFGLPDVEPMQQAIMDQMQERLLASVDQFSPTALLKDWFGPLSAVQQTFLGAFRQAGAAGSAYADSGPAGAGGAFGTSAAPSSSRSSESSETEGPDDPSRTDPTSS